MKRNKMSEYFELDTGWVHNSLALLFFYLKHEIIEIISKYFGMSVYLRVSPFFWYQNQWTVSVIRAILLICKSSSDFFKFFPRGRRKCSLPYFVNFYHKLFKNGLRIVLALVI